MILTENRVELLPKVIYSPFLAEVRNIGRALYNFREREIACSYARCNEQAALLEAVSKQSVSVSQQLLVDGQFAAFNQPLVPMFERGLAAATRKMASDSRFKVEVWRRSKELEEQLQLNELAQSGELNSHYLLTISPYPEEMDEKTSQELGYFPQERVGKIRIHDFNPQTGMKQTIEFFFTRSSLEKVRLIAAALGLGDSFSHLVNPSQTLDQRVLVSKLRVGSWLDLLRLLGPVLYDGQHQDIIAKSQVVLSEAQPLIDSLVNLDTELALSLEKRQPTARILQMINLYLRKYPRRMTSFPELDRNLLLFGRSYFTDEVAIVLKKIALMNTYTQVAVLTDQPSVKHLAYMKRYIRDHLSIYDNPAIDGFMMGRLGSPGFAFCGVALDPANYLRRLFGLESKFECPNCNRITYGPVGDRCPKCNITKAEWKEKLEKDGLDAETCE